LTEAREQERPASASAEPVPLSDPEFKEQLAAVIPHLRAFGRSLSGSRDLADDLVQETLLKAWAARKRFQAGTNMRAWTFIILRNLFLSQMRRARFKGEWDDITASKILAAPASQDRHIELGDMQRALMHLPQPQREALILVGAGGFAYEEAAEICGCAVGTIKSRVAGESRSNSFCRAASCPHAGSTRRIPTSRRCRLSWAKSTTSAAITNKRAPAKGRTRFEIADGQFSLRRSSAKSRSHGSDAAASKARRSAAVIPACDVGVSTRMMRRSIALTSDPEMASGSSFIGIANDRTRGEVSYLCG
jgi:RNA polymerase sigma-70 factor (ECF subfamily)